MPAKHLVLTALLALGMALPALAEPLQWFRGNTHTHTLNSDGDASPETVVRWYREHGYQFVVITDHEFITDVQPLQALFGAEGKFVVMKGQEVSQIIDDPSYPDNLRPVHLTAIEAAKVVLPIGQGQQGKARVMAPRGTTPVYTYERNIAAIAAAGGIAQVNHPNFRWAVGADDLAQLPDRTLLEIWNGHPLAHNLGGSDESGRHALSTEALWDAVLSRGRMVWGVGADDSHEYYGGTETNGPGRAWIMVRADRLTPQSITASLSRGDFYASTGIFLDDIAANAKEVVVTIRPEKPLLNRAVNVVVSDDTRYLTRFIGKNGSILAEVPGRHPHYSIGKGDGYVRASITDSRGQRAWVQPVFVNREEKVSK